MIRRRNLFIPDSMWDAVRMAAQLQGLREKRAVSNAEWVREAIRQRLDREEGGGRKDDI